MLIPSRRIQVRLIRDPFRKLQETLDEIHDDYYAGRLSDEQRRKYEREAYQDLGVQTKAREVLQSN